MRLFLGGLICLLSATTAMAQINPLFPELGVQAPKTQKPAVVEPVADTTPAAKPAPLFPELSINQKAEQEAAEVAAKTSGNIRLVIDDINATLPPARNFSYCFGSLTLQNETNRKVESLVVNLTFGTADVQLSFSGVNPKASQKQNLALAGDICQAILSVPKMDITTCKMVGNTEKDCKKRVEFVPIP